MFLHNWAAQEVSFIIQALCCIIDAYVGCLGYLLDFAISSISWTSSSFFKLIFVKIVTDFILGF